MNPEESSPWCARDIRPTCVVILLAVCQEELDVMCRFLYYPLSIFNVLLVPVLSDPTHVNGRVDYFTAIRAEMRILEADNLPIAIT
jgi:hypothetical protein